MKIEKTKLTQYLREGKSKEEIAQIYNVTVQAVYKRINSLNLLIVKDVGLESGHKVLAQSLDTVEQLFDINEVTRKILAELTGEDHIIDNMTKAVQAFIDYEAKPTKSKANYIKDKIKIIISEKNTAIKACDQILRQLNFQHEIYKTLYDLTAIQEFQQEVLSTIAEVAPEVRNAIIKRLKDKRALRQSVTIVSPDKLGS